MLGLIVAVVLDLLASVAVAVLALSWLPPILSVVRAAVAVVAVIVATRKGRVVALGARHAVVLRTGDTDDEDEDEVKGEAAGLVSEVNGGVDEEDPSVVYWWQAGLIVTVLAATVASVVPLVMRLALSGASRLASGAATVGVLCAYGSMSSARREIVRRTTDPGLKLPSHAHRMEMLVAGEGYRGMCDVCEETCDFPHYHCGSCSHDVCLACARASFRSERRGMDTAPPVTFAQGARLCLDLLRPRWVVIVAGLAALLAQEACWTAVPWLTGAVLDAIATANSTLFGRYLIVLGGVALGGALSISVSNYLFTFLGAAIATDLKRVVFARFLSQPFAFFDREKIGDLMSRLDNDTERVADPVGRSMQSIVAGAVSVAAALVMCYVTNAALTLVAVAMMLPIGLMRFWFSGWAYRIEKSNWGIQGEMVEVARQALTMIRTVRLFQREDALGEAFGTHAQRRLGLARREALGQAGSHVMESLFENALRILILLYGGWTVTTSGGVFTIGALITFQLYFELLTTSFEGITQHLDSVVRGGASLDRLMVALTSVPLQPQTGTPIEAIESIELQDVSFKYESRDALVLDRVSLVIPRGKTVALVGRSGGGKSTICGLVSALYEELQSGRVLVNGRDLRGIDKRSYHGLLGVVMQDTELFNATIESNIAFGARGACTHEEVVAACKQANAHDFVAQLEEGYQTKVGERGLKLSGGQRQRLALARVLIRKPQLLILDETTSALDAESEAVVQQSIDALLAQGNVTVVLVAHRLSTVMNADKICVIEQGRVVEEGNHAQLLARRGVYFKLVSRQVQKLANTLELDAHDPREVLKRSAGCEATIDSLLDEN